LRAGHLKFGKIGLKKMPTYSYTCDACGKSFEKEQRIVEDPIKVCELCGKPKARRQIISGNFILKGGGWYSDGYGSAKSSSGSSGSSSTSSSSSSTSTSSESSKSSDSGTKSESKSSSRVEAAE
jgi:putative FmdB family regulatory protein